MDLDLRSVFEAVPALPFVDGICRPVDPASVAASLGIDNLDEAIAALYRCGLLKVCLDDAALRKQWTTPEGEPSPHLLRAVSEAKLRFRTRNLDNLRHRVLALAQLYAKLEAEAGGIEETALAF